MWYVDVIYLQLVKKKSEKMYEMNIISIDFLDAEFTIHCS
jgi:hypothetical protein